MDSTVFAHLRPKDRIDEYAGRVRQFIERCPANEETSHWHRRIISASSRIDMGANYRTPYHTDDDQYRVRTKMRRFEVRYIVLLLPFVDLYGDDDLEEECSRLIEAGMELIGVFDAIIKACS